MSHNITDRDGVFTVRTPAWHGLGHVFPDHPTREEAKAVGHNWEPISEPVYRRVPMIDETGQPSVTYEEIEDAQAIVRSDTADTLGVVSGTYEPVSNEEMYDIAEVIQGESADVMFETGGSLKGGKKVWLLLRLNEPLRVGTLRNNDLTATVPYFSLQNAFDGSGAFRGAATMTRIVCDNTAVMSDMDATARGTQFAFSHTKNVKDRIEQAKQALAGWRDSVEVWQRMSEHLLNEQVSERGVTRFIEEFIPMPNTTLISDRVQNNVIEAQGQLRGILNSETCADISHTAYGLVQGSIEYVQHARKARSAESRFRRAYLEPSRLTTDAVALAQEAVMVG